MNEIIKDVQQNATLVIAVAITTALGTILLKKLFCGKKKRKYPRGSGPTGKGKWKLYHSKTLRSSRCLLLIEGLTKLKLISSVRILRTSNEINTHFYVKHLSTWTNLTKQAAKFVLFSCRTITEQPQLQHKIISRFLPEILHKMLMTFLDIHHHNLRESHVDQNILREKVDIAC